MQTTLIRNHSLTVEVTKKSPNMASTEHSVRPASHDDISAINIIHKHYVQNTVITFSTEPNSDEATLSNYQEVKSEGLPYVVATDEEGVVVGFAYCHAFRGTKPGYRHSLELTLFVHPDRRRKGIGGLLLTRIIDVLKRPESWIDHVENDRLTQHKPRQLLAIMAIDIEGPGEGWKLRDWYLQYGFVQRGHLKEVGWKKERWVDTLYLQLSLGD